LFIAHLRSKPSHDNPGSRVLGTSPRIDAYGKPVLFLHPKDFIGTLIELEQA
jgi:methylmalonyl-CoA/ethylmalonyl-CoA epimerase